MAGKDNPLAYGTGYTDPTNPLTQGSPTWADAYSYNAPIVRDYLMAQRQRLSDPQTYVNALRDWAGAMVGGTEAPGIRAFHGSPHSFERFDTSKIGTGEGAQVYGHGLYFAEHEPVAQTYRTGLSPPNFNETASGVPISSDVSRMLQDGWDTVKDLGAPNVRDAHYIAQSSVKQQLDDAAKAGDWEWYNKAADQSAELARIASDLPKSGGSMYEVTLRADPEHMLNWDKPLSEQSQYVRDRLSAWNNRQRQLDQLPTHVAGPRQEGEARGAPVEPSGQSVYNHISAVSGNDFAAGAKALQDAGIPGIRYLDAGSRGQGEGTSNYVVFDANTIDILRKYGIAGLMTGGAAAGASQQDQ